MVRMNREFWRPRESEHCQDLEKLESEGVYEVYKFRRGDRYIAMCFGGKRSKPDSHYYYPSAEARDKYVREYIENQESRVESRKAARAERGKAERNLKVGDVLYASWGYDQTNIDYYQVAELVGKMSVRIVPISSVMESSSPPCDMVKPAVGVLRDYDVLLGLDRGWQEKEPQGVLKRVRDGSVRLCSHAHASKCDPDQARYETSSGWGH